MPDLSHTLQGTDLGFLKMIAGAWGIELNSPDVNAGLPVLVNAIQNRRLAEEVIEALPSGARDALQALVDHNGSMPWSLFCRKYGDVRVMGAARRDRERPDLHPDSPVEWLWYRALIGKAFFNLPPEPQEFAFIPDELLGFLRPLQSVDSHVLGQPAQVAETTHKFPATDRLVDHACTLLAALRLNPTVTGFPNTTWEMPVPTLICLLQSAELLDSHNTPLLENTRSFLESNRAAALSHLCRTWLGSPSFNDLRLLPGLHCEGDWKNNPLEARQVLLKLISTLPRDQWWSLPAFIAAIKDRYPDFQRPAGAYEEWFIRKEGSQEFLHGFSAWDEVDGALIHFIITGPMHWLGMMDLASPSPGGPPAAFRPSAWAADLLTGQLPQGLPVENAPIRISADGHLRLSSLTPRPVRYQIARFCEWLGETDKDYFYLLTPATLERAQQQGLRTAHLMTLLKDHSGNLPPLNLIKALKHWEQFGVQAGIKNVSLLRVASPDILEALGKTRAARFLGEAINPTTIVIKPGGEEFVRRALVEAGYLAGSELDV